MRIAVVDGQGGGIGARIIEAIRHALPEGTELLALGTNAMATVQMLRAGANEGASGENAIVQNVGRVDVVLGTVSILVANSFLGELTPRAAEAISSCRARKLLLPLTLLPVRVVGSPREPLPHLVDLLIQELLEPDGG